MFVCLSMVNVSCGLIYLDNLIAGSCLSRFWLLCSIYAYFYSVIDGDRGNKMVYGNFLSSMPVPLTIAVILS